MNKLKKEWQRLNKGRARQLRRFRRTGKDGYKQQAARLGWKMRQIRQKIMQITQMRRTSPAGAGFIASFEGFFDRPYNDPVGYATVGYGHLLGMRPVIDSDNSAIWVEGQHTSGRLTEKEGKRLLMKTLKDRFEPAVSALFAKGGPLEGKFTRGRFESLVSFSFNLGSGAVIPGTPGFETIGRAIAAGDTEAIADSMLLYDKAGGSALPGLTRRRRSEARLFRTGSYATN